MEKLDSHNSGGFEFHQTNNMISDLCRLCAQKKRNKVDLLTSEEGQVLISKILFCLSVQVTVDDMLPKMICVECHRNVEQFNTFRIKCTKAEERLNKMLTLNLPNKSNMVTRIKQETLETDFHEIASVGTSILIPCKSDLCKRTDIIPTILPKPVKNVKSEISEVDEHRSCETDEFQAHPDLIQIISEEMLNQNPLDDVKQPHIEIICENFDEVKKIDLGCSAVVNVKCPHINMDVDEDDSNQRSCYENISSDDEIIKSVHELPVQSESSFNLPENLSIVNEAKCDIKQSEPKARELKIKKEHKRKQYKKIPDIIESDTTIDEKYLVLGENEKCDIDVEAMEAEIVKKQNPKAVFKCDKCEKQFKFFKALRKHKASIHEVKMGILKCHLCTDEKMKGFEFLNQRSLRQHIYHKHCKAEVVQCDICDKSLANQSKLNMHVKLVHDVTSTACKVCGRCFKTEMRLKNHARVHRCERPYVCEECGRGFKWSNALKNHHRLMHRRERNYLCSECGKEFASKNNLVEHLNIHTGARPHTCQDCGASFAQVGSYTKHIKSHDPARYVFQCRDCGKSFPLRSTLKAHQRVHSCARPFQCDFCLATLKSRANLNLHMKTHLEKKYACSMCSRTFAMPKTLREHLAWHNGIKHVCPVPDCGKTYSQRFPLSKHFRKTHPRLTIINRVGGKRLHLPNKPVEMPPETQYIQYGFKLKDVLSV